MTNRVRFEKVWEGAEHEYNTKLIHETIDLDPDDSTRMTIYPVEDFISIVLRNPHDPIMSRLEAQVYNTTELGQIIHHLQVMYKLLEEIEEEKECPDLHLGCPSYPNCDIDPNGCIKTPGETEWYGSRD